MIKTTKQVAKRCGNWGMVAVRWVIASIRWLVNLILSEVVKDGLMWAVRLGVPALMVFFGGQIENKQDQSLQLMEQLHQKINILQVQNVTLTMQNETLKSCLDQIARQGAFDKTSCPLFGMPVEQGGTK